MKRKMILFLSLALILTSMDFTYAAPIDDVVSGINRIIDITDDML